MAFRLKLLQNLRPLNFEDFLLEELYMYNRNELSTDPSYNM
jgi:hypothetical protein